MAEESNRDSLGSIETNRDKAHWNDLDGGYVMVPLSLFKLALSARAKLLYVVIRAHLNIERDDRESWPSIPILTDETSLSRNHVKAGIAELEAHDPPLIAHRNDKRVHNSNVYLVQEVGPVRAYPNTEVGPTRTGGRPNPGR